jgi:hypothetical protein
MTCLPKETAPFTYVYRDSSKKMPVIAYADDVFKGLNCVDPQQIRSILQVQGADDILGQTHRQHLK